MSIFNLVQKVWRSFDQSIKYIDHFVNFFSFGNLHGFIWFNVFDHFIPISEGDFKFTKILSKSNVLNLGIFISFIFNFSDSDDRIVDIVVSSIYGENGLFNSSVQQ